MTEHRFFLTFSALLAGVILICSGALLYLLRPEGAVPAPWAGSPPQLSAAEEPLPPYDAEALARQIDEADAALLALDLPAPDYTGSLDGSQTELAEAKPDAEPWWSATRDGPATIPTQAQAPLPSSYSAGSESLEANVAALETPSESEDGEGLTGEGGSDAELTDEDELADAGEAEDAPSAPAPAVQKRPQPSAQPAPRNEPARQQQRPRSSQVATAEPAPQGPLATLFGGGGGSTGGSERTPMMLGPSGRRVAAAPAQRGQSAAAYARTVRAMVARNKPRANARGSATVAFSIRPNGGLGAVQVRRSSGNSRVDQLASQAVRNAAPFPAPPAGAATSYSVRIHF